VFVEEVAAAGGARGVESLDGEVAANGGAMPERSPPEGI